MDHDFWHDRWASGRIGFHEPAANGLLVKHLQTLGLKQDSRIFLPLCGKTNDIAWLLSQGFRVAGAELSRVAIDQLFAALGVTPAIHRAGPLLHYCAPEIDIFAGDIFDLTPQVLGATDAVFDRAALVALPDQMRQRYVQHLMQITGHAPHLLVTFDYDQTAMAGPPFAVSAAMVRAYYAAHFTVSALETRPVTGGFKGGIPATETLWHLSQF